MCSLFHMIHVRMPMGEEPPNMVETVVPLFPSNIILCSGARC